MYVSDDKTDEVVAKHAQLQSAIRGTTVLLVVPGHGSHMLVGLGLMLGWMGTSLAVYGLTNNSRTMLPYLLSAGLIAVSIMSILLYQVLRGQPAARRRMFKCTVVLAIVALCVLSAAVVWGDRATLLVSVVGAAASALTARCIAGANYALFAAFFRAKRKYADQLRELGAT